MLKPNERIVVIRRYGIGGDEETLEKIGDDFGLTRERIRQIEAKALKHLRKPNIANFLKPHHASAEWRLLHAPEVLKPYDADHPFGLRRGISIEAVAKT